MTENKKAVIGGVMEETSRWGKCKETRGASRVMCMATALTVATISHSTHRMHKYVQCSICQPQFNKAVKILNEK